MVDDHGGSGYDGNLWVDLCLGSVAAAGVMAVGLAVSWLIRRVW